VRLDLADNALTCSANDSIGTLTALRELDLSYNKLSLSPSCDACTALETLLISNNLLKCFPESLSNMFRSLRVLDVSHNGIHVIPQVVVDLMCVALEELIVAQNLIEHIPPLPIAKDGFCLRRFDFKGNKVTFEDVRELIELEFAGRLHLAHFYETVPQLLLGGVYLGSGEAARNVNVLVKLGITHILNAATTRHRQGSDPFQYLTLELEDTPGQEVLHLLERAHTFIDSAVQRGSGVLIHCQAGVSRSVTIAASYLMRQHKMTVEEALEFVRSKRPAAKPITHFVEQLKRYEMVLQ
jgi:protein-tyrosine phosphatase